jgi:hypothetical protein
VLLTPRDRSILATLTSKVRLVTLHQVAATWWSGSGALPNARQRVRRLRQADLLDARSLPAHPLLPLAAPIFTWAPGQPDPDCGAMAYHLQHRWTTQYQPTTVYFATHRAALHLGAPAPGRVEHPDQVTHDLHVSALYLRLRREHPDLAAAWVGEDVFAAEREGQKLPDAVLKDSRGRVVLVIEFGGKYDPDRVRAFHDDCRRRQHSYQLW